MMQRVMARAAGMCPTAGSPCTRRAVAVATQVQRRGMTVAARSLRGGVGSVLAHQRPRRWATRSECGAQWLARGFASSFEPGEAIRMPALSPTMESGQIVEWLVTEGQAVEAGDALVEIQTDKATLPLETQESGVVARILGKAGEDIKVGQVIGVLAEDESDVAAVQALSFSAGDLLPLDSAPTDSSAQEAPAPAEAAPAAAAGSGAGASGGRTGGFITPAARHMIESLGLDGSAIPASGPGGRVLKADVLAFLGKIPPQTPMSSRKAGAGATASSAHAAAGTAAAPAASTGAAAGAGGGAPAAPVTPVERAGGTFTDVKPSQMRAVIAKRLTESKATVPHFYVTMDCYIDDLMKARKQLQAAGIKLSVNDMIIKAAAMALTDVPQANAYWDTVSNEVVANSAVDVCVAVATPGGLITPIVKAANTMSLPAINTKVGDLATRARAGRLAPDEFQGGTFTISNLGMFGIDEFSAVINPPQAAILAVGGGERVLAFPGGDDTQAPVAVTRMTVQLSVDRRVMDEGVAAQFLQVMRQYLHTPLLL